VTLAVFEPSPEVWDSWVDQHPRGHLLQLSAWGALKAAFGWRVLRVAIVGGTLPSRPDYPPILAGAQILFRQRYGVSVAYVPRGPLLSGDDAIDTMLLALLEHVSRRRRAVFLRLEPEMLEQEAGADRYHSWLLCKGFRTAAPIQPRSSIHLDVARTEKELFASFRKGHRADIRRAERQGVSVRVGTSSDIAAFYAMMQSTGKRANFGIHTQEYYRQAALLFGERSRLLFAEQEEQTIAAHMVFADAHTGLYLYSGATEAGLKSGANHLLQWHALQWAHTRGCHRYDFWGIPDALGRAATIARTPEEHTALEEEAQQDPLIGVYRFKKGFGGNIVRYLPAYDQVFLAPFYAIWQRRLH